MNTEFHQSRGNVHTGSGDQWNLVLQMTKERVAARRGEGAWSETTFEHMSARFQAPEGFPEIRDAIEHDRVVILKGDPGSGRRSAALELLGKSEYGRGLFYAPVVGSDDDDSLDRFPKEAADRILVDLSAMNVDRFTSLVAPDLQPFFERVQAKRARSVVILPDAAVPEPDWLKIVKPIGRPNPVEAYRKHLRTIGVPADDLDEPAIRDYFKHAPMRDLARLTLLVQEARDANPTLDYRAWIRTAWEVLRAGRDEVAAILKELRAGQQRALLLSASLFAGGSADGAWHAAKILLDTLKYPEDTGLPLDQADLQEQLAVFGAGIDRQRHIQFQKPLDAAIRSYIWDGYPALRASLAGWIKALSKHWKWSLVDAERVAERFGEQHLRTRQLSAVLKLIPELAGMNAEVPFQQALALLKLGLDHPEFGWNFRKEMREWAKDRTLSDGLGAVLIEACVQVLAASYPDQALVRLHHLARHGGQIGTMACGALGVQLEEDRLSRMLSLLLKRMADQSDKRDPGVFVSVIDPSALTGSRGNPRPLAAEPVVRAHLVLAWRATLTVRPQGWEQQLDRWLAIVDRRRDRDLLLSILAEAPDSLASRSCLHAATTAWATGWAGDWDVADALLERMNAAQGISFVTMERTEQ